MTFTLSEVLGGASVTRHALEERVHAWRLALTPLHGGPPSPSSSGIRVLVQWDHPGPELEQQRRDARTDVVDLRAAETYTIGVKGAITAETRSAWLKEVAMPHPSWHASPPVPTAT